MTYHQSHWNKGWTGLVPVHWLYTFVCLFYFLDASNGGFQGHKNGHSSGNVHNELAPDNPILVPSRWSEPYFDTTLPQNVTALAGKSAYLSCRVINLGNKTVSFVRHRDLHILTVGTYTYTSDQRFIATYHRDINEWTLQIKWAQKRDAGAYECQISTQPVKSFSIDLSIVANPELTKAAQGFFKSLYTSPYYPAEDDSNFVQQDDSRFHGTLNTNDAYSSTSGDSTAAASVFDSETDDAQLSSVEVPTATILGGPDDLYVDKGSSINLTCLIRFSPEPPAYIFWYHQNDVVSAESREGIKIHTEHHDDAAISYLLIKKADFTDSGKYTCSPSNAELVSIRVNVLNGERPEAMQTGSSNLANKTNRLFTFIVISYIFEYFLPIFNTYYDIDDVVAMLNR